MGGLMIIVIGILFQKFNDTKYKVNTLILDIFHVNSWKNT